MKLKLFFLLLLHSFSVYLKAANNINYKQLKQKDDLVSWCEFQFQEIISLEDEEKFTEAEAVCDYIINNLWRAPKTVEEFDVLTKVYAYKGFYFQDKEMVLDANNAFETSLQYYELSSKVNENYLAILYTKLGINYTKIGDNDKAILILNKMIGFAKSKDDNQALVQAYINLSIAYENKGNTRIAKETLLETIPYFEDVSLYRKALVYSNLGAYSIAESNDFFEAKSYLLKAEILLKKSDVDAYYLAGVYRSLGEIFILENNENQAHKYLNEAIQSYRKSSINRNREIAKTYVFLSKISLHHISLYYLDSAYYELTHNNLREAKKEDIYAENTFLEIFSEQNKQTESIDKKLFIYELIYKTEQELRAAFLFESSKYDVLAASRKNLNEILEICFEAFSETKNIKYVYKAFEFLEVSKSVILYENLNYNLNQESRDDFIVYKENLRLLKTELLQASLVDDETSKNNINQKINQLKFDFSIQNKDFNRLINDDNEAFNLEDFLSNYLKKDEAVASYFVSENYVYGILISNQITDIFRFKKNDFFLNELKAYKSSFKFENRFKFDKISATKLGEKLIPFSLKNISKLIIISDEGLNNIPFEALIKKEQYLIEQVEIYYAFSAQILNHKTEKKINNNKLIAFAPIFKNDNRKHLQKSKEEIEEINKYLTFETYFEDQANSSNFIALAPKYSIIHISTHAQINDKLNTASIDFYDKSLFFNQIVDENFSSNLLVLSACETGIGENRIGEGSMSLSRAFAYANIPASISSLWQVNEQSSVYILSSFYKFLSEKKSISNALHLSKLDYLRDKDISDEKKLPYFWASYVLVGKDRILTVEQGKWYSNSNFLVFLGILSLLTTCYTFYYKKQKS